MEVIYDYETLSTDRVKGVVLSMALCVYDPNRFTAKDQYSYTELLETTRFIKFDVQDQVKNYGRKIDQDTLKWWGEQSKEAQRSQLAPSEKDQPLSECLPFVNKHTQQCSIQKVFTRGNTFDPLLLDYIALDTKQIVPFPHWTIRDTRSYIEGMGFGTDIKNGFVPDGLDEFFVPHDPQHDITMDVMRMQTLAIALG